MSDLARRTLRTTAAAAGMAALGVGLAGNALAATSVPEPEQPTGPAPALPALPGLAPQNPLAALPALPTGQALPMLFVFQGPTVHSPTINTAAAPVPDALRLPVAAPVSTSTPGSPESTDRTESTNSGPVRAQVAPAPSTPSVDQVGALSGLDSANLFDGLARQAVVDQHGLGTSTLGLNDLT